jgi:hypothetical protein
MDGPTRYSSLTLEREEHLKTDFKEAGFDIADWIELAQERVQRQAFLNKVMNLLITSVAANF